MGILDGGHGNDRNGFCQKGCKIPASQAWRLQIIKSALLFLINLGTEADGMNIGFSPQCPLLH
jgi:hypothetical protein